jgi:hypothetical protein
MDEILMFVVLAGLAVVAMNAAKQSGAKLGLPAIAVPVVGTAIVLAARKLR